MSQPVFQGWFSHAIRRNRKSYFFATLSVWGLLMIVFLFAFFSLVAKFAGSDGRTPHTFTSTGIILWLIFPILYVYLLLAAQRLRDINSSGWWVLVFFPCVFGMLFYSEIAIFIALCLVICQLSLLFIPGTEGKNKYGPSPLNRRIGTKKARPKKRKVAVKGK